MMGSNGTTIQHVLFINIITEAQAQKGGRRPDCTITVARQCDILALTSFGSIQGKTIVQNSRLFLPGISAAPLRPSVVILRDQATRFVRAPIS